MLHRRRTVGLTALGLLLLLVGPGTVSARSPNKAAHKAALIYRVATFVKWPESAMPDGPVVISVLAADRVAAALGEIAPRRSIDGHPLEVRRIESIREGDECHILFVGARARARTNEILAAVAGRSVLTISDARGFARKGGMVEFTRKGQRLAFEVHRGAALRAELRISARLLALASAVYGDAPAGVP